MENFEADFENNSYFDEIALAFSGAGEEAIEISENYTAGEIELTCDSLSSTDLIANISEVFEKNIMNEHLATIDLLGNLGYTDMLMYYCAVMDCVFIKNELDNNEQTQEIVTPRQYINDIETNEKKIIDFEIEVSKSRFSKFIKVLKYLKNKEFKILSNTFYMDGSDFILCLSLKSVVGYNLRMKVVFKCDSATGAATLEVNFHKIQQNILLVKNSE